MRASRILILAVPVTTSLGTKDGLFLAWFRNSFTNAGVISLSSVTSGCWYEISMGVLLSTASCCRDSVSTLCGVAPAGVCSTKRLTWESLLDSTAICKSYCPLNLSSETGGSVGSVAAAAVSLDISKDGVKYRYCGPTKEAEDEDVGQDQEREQLSVWRLSLQCAEAKERGRLSCKVTSTTCNKETYG